MRRSDPESPFLGEPTVWGVIHTAHGMCCNHLMEYSIYSKVWEERTCSNITLRRGCTTRSRRRNHIKNDAMIVRAGLTGRVSPRMSGVSI
jgi:hypothetical protein